MVDDIILQKRTLRVLIISALLVTVCLIFLNPDLAIPSDPSQIDYFGVLAVFFSGLFGSIIYFPFLG